MTGFGDWMMFYMIAKNIDRVVFTQVMESIKYPDYDYDAEPLDIENKRFEEFEKGNNGDDSTSSLKKEKKRFLTKSLSTVS